MSNCAPYGLRVGIRIAFSRVALPRQSRRRRYIIATQRWSRSLLDRALPVVDLLGWRRVLTIPIVHSMLTFIPGDPAIRFSCTLERSAQCMPKRAPAVNSLYLLMHCLCDRSGPAHGASAQVMSTSRLCLL